MRLTLAVAVLAIAASGSLAYADDASDLAAAKSEITAAKLSSNSDLYMWCGAAMTLVSNATKDSDPATSKATDAASTALFTKASASLTADGVTQDNFSKLTDDYMTEANAQLFAKSEAASHSQDDCEAAAK